MNPEKAEEVESGTASSALEPLLKVNRVAERAHRGEYNERIENLAATKLSRRVALLKQIKGRGHADRSDHMLTLEEIRIVLVRAAERGLLSADFSRDVGTRERASRSYWRLSKEGDPYLRTLLGAGSAALVRDHSASRL